MRNSSDAGISLAKALHVGHGDVVSFVGGGGKTTSMFRLAGELSASGLRVLTTTTTHISEEQVHLSPASIRPEEIKNLGNHLDRFGQCLLVGPPDGKGSVLSIHADMIAVLKERPDIDCILVEADGSKSRPFKAPGSHEPIVPAFTTVLVPIAGLNSLGCPLDDSTVHRPEIVASLAGSRIGSPIAPETVAKVLSHTCGGAKGLPSGGRLVPLLNKVDKVGIRMADEVAVKLLKYSNVDSVIVGSMDRDPPVREVWIPTAGLVLAAGQATRCGSLKQVLPWKDTTLVAHAARAAAEAGLDPVVVVVGYESEKVIEKLKGHPVRVVNNPEFAAGQSTSLRAGIDALPERPGAALFLLADQPLIDAGIIETILSAHRKTLAPICVPVFERQRGNPVLFDRSLFPELLNLKGDTGGRELIEKYQDALVTVPVGNAAVSDIDIPEDYQRLIGRL
ncbi:MAG: selenium cofactor biosynthesis protein YqeC [Acidobacteriota bacterium]